MKQDRLGDVAQAVAATLEDVSHSHERSLVKAVDLNKCKAP